MNENALADFNKAQMRRLLAVTMQLILVLCEI
jgi:hypothetical protein